MSMLTRRFFLVGSAAAAATLAAAKPAAILADAVTTLAPSKPARALVALEFSRADWMPGRVRIARGAETYLDYRTRGSLIWHAAPGHEVMFVEPLDVTLEPCDEHATLALTYRNEAGEWFSEAYKGLDKSAPIPLRLSIAWVASWVRAPRAADPLGSWAEKRSALISRQPCAGRR